VLLTFRERTSTSLRGRVAVSADKWIVVERKGLEKAKQIFNEGRPRSLRLARVKVNSSCLPTRRSSREMTSNLARELLVCHDLELPSRLRLAGCLGSSTAVNAAAKFAAVVLRHSSHYMWRKT